MRPDRLPVRAKLEYAIETLIVYLDTLDGDPDLEADLAGSAALPLPDLEIEVTDCEMDEADLEPSLGSVSRQGNQERWAQGAADDTELEHEGG
jgi:hypothetical protein